MSVFKLVFHKSSIQRSRSSVCL